MVSKHVILIVALLGIQILALAQDDKHVTSTRDSVININNNRILISQYSDSIFSENPITSGITYIIEEAPGPVQLNGEKIFSIYNEDATHYTKLSKGKKYLVEYLQRKTNRYYKKLAKAGYNADIRNIVVNAKGEIIYYEYSGVIKTDTSNQEKLKPELIVRINKKVKKVLDKVQLMPATIDHTAIAYRINHYELL